MAAGLEIRQIKNWHNHIKEFWELHPSATKMGEFKKLYKPDTSENKYASSRKAWYCVLYIHPESDFYNLEHEDKMNDLMSDLFPSTEPSKFQKRHDSLLPLIKFVEIACLSKTVKHLHVLYNKIEERAELYAKTPYTMENAKLLDDMLKSEKAIISAIQECEDIIKQSQKDGSIKGNAELSLMEGGSLFN